jgi:hypothetical protein
MAILREVIKGLLQVEAKERKGLEWLKSHRWFSQYEWNELLNRNYKV